MKGLQLAMVLGLLLTCSCAGRPPENIGVHEESLSPCPDTPNCVSSMETRENRQVAPFSLGSAGKGALDCLEGIVRGMERTQVLERRQEYLHAAFASRVFGFVDDMEFLLDSEAGVLHVRSAARLGYTDFGVNRERVAQLRQAFARGCSAKASLSRES